MKHTGLLLATLLMAAPALAVRLDDSLSPRSRVDVQALWTNDITPHRVLSRTEMHALTARIPGHEVRLNTGAYVGRTVQIFLVLPIQIQGLKSPAGMRLEWQTRGVFSAGATRPGSRTLIYQGPVNAAVMSEVFDFTIQMDGQFVDGRLQFDPQFELEVIK
jgi:hypothetical protein